MAFTKACIDAVKLLSQENADLLVLGNTKSEMFPKELLPLASERQRFGKGGLRVNFLVNYGWQWDLAGDMIKSKDISRIDMIVRWGGCRRLSGFLPVQSVYADFYIIDDYWPDFKPEHLYEALDWYSAQDITLGG